MESIAEVEVISTDEDADEAAPTIESLSTKEKRALVQNEKRADLKVAEKTIEKGKGSLLAMQAALYQISTERLYKVAIDPISKKAYKTFKDYCEGRWGFSPQYGNRMVREHRDALALESGLEPEAKVTRNTARALAGWEAAGKIEKAYNGFTHVANRYNERVQENEKFWSDFEKAQTASNKAWDKFFDTYPGAD
jgi:hypothetical protein